MSSQPVIDLCESSADEAEPEVESAWNFIPPASGHDQPSTPAAQANVKTKDEAYWDSSDEEEFESIISRKTQQWRRKSKVVTPEDHLKASASANDKEDCPSSDGGQTSRRKHPRTLFSTSRNNSTQSPAPMVASKTKSTNQKRHGPKQSAWDSDDSSSDESFTFEPAFAKKTPIVKSKGCRGTTNSNRLEKKNGTIIGIESSDDEGGAVTQNALTKGSSLGRHDTTPVVSKGSKTINPCANKRRRDHNGSSASIPQNVGGQILQYPNVGPSSGRQYKDLRASYILALWKYCRTLVSASYNLPKLDSYCRRMKDLALSEEFPIRSIEEFIGNRDSVESNALRDALQSGGVKNIQIPTNHSPRRDGYFSVTEAALVAMLEIVESSPRLGQVDLCDESQAATFCSNRDQWVYLSDLIPQIDKRLNMITPSRLRRTDSDDNGEAFYTNPSTRSVEYKQLDQLTKAEAKADMPYLKSHRRDKRVCYELTMRGFRKATDIRDRRFPMPPGYLRTSKLYSDAVDPCFQGICLVVDNREGGGASNKLHAMCQALDIRKVPYVVTKLDIGDYAFVSMDTQKYLPIIVERKSIQDVAQSIWDGRWISQKLRMYQGQYVFGFDSCRMGYLIEGHADSQELTDGAMGQRHFNVSRTQLDSEIENLQSQGFEVLTTNNVNGSLARLVELSKEVAQSYRSGKIEAKLTYDEFTSRVQSIPNGVNFSRIAKDHKEASDAKRGEASNRNEVRDLISTEHRCAVPEDSKQGTQRCRYESLKLPQLKEQCEKFGLSKTGKKADLISRLLGPRPPNAWLLRKKANLYVPSRFDTCASAILISTWLHQRQQVNSDTWKGLEKDEIINLAESLNISRDPFTGTGKGLFNYDGWSCMGPLREGQCPLIFRQKGGFFKLTTLGGVMSGMEVAEAMHEWCHAHQKCRCDEVALS